MSRRAKAILVTALCATACALVWLFGPVLTFKGGKYRHARSECVYEFRDGRMLENGKDIASYRHTWRGMHITLDNEDLYLHVSIEFHATVSWNTVTMPIPKYGPRETLKRTR